MIATVIGTYPKPKFFKLTDWFNTNKTDKKYPTLVEQILGND